MKKLLLIALCLTIIGGCKKKNPTPKATPNSVMIVNTGTKNVGLAKPVEPYPASSSLTRKDIAIDDTLFYTQSGTDTLWLMLDSYNSEPIQPSEWKNVKLDVYVNGSLNRVYKDYNNVFWISFPFRQ